MLGLATTLRVDLAIDHAPPGPAGVRERVTVEKRAGESGDHVLLKLLAFALHHRPGLAIEVARPVRHPGRTIPARVTDARFAPKAALSFGSALRASRGQRYKPDLLLADPDGTVRLWIDCGHVGPRKLADVLRRNRAAEVVVLKPTAREARLFATSASKRLARSDRLRLEAFRDGFLADLGALVADRGRLEVRVGGGTVRVSAAGRTVESPVVAVPLGGSVG